MGPCTVHLLALNVRLQAESADNSVIVSHTKAHSRYRSAAVDVSCLGLSLAFGIASGGVMTLPVEDYKQCLDGIHRQWTVAPRANCDLPVATLAFSWITVIWVRLNVVAC